MTNNRVKATFTGLVLLVTVTDCNLAHQADAQFGDQHFKTIIALVELYKVRHGAYPAALGDLDFIGDWDKMSSGTDSGSRSPTQSRSFDAEAAQPVLQSNARLAERQYR